MALRRFYAMLFLTPEAGICWVFCRGVFLAVCYVCVFVYKNFSTFCADCSNYKFSKIFRKKACIFLSGVLKYNHQIKAVELLI